ncbi:MAG: hypothetical protein ABIL92_08220, partial [candidate division WOR-3 bacterium]
RGNECPDTNTGICKEIRRPLLGRWKKDYDTEEKPAFSPFEDPQRRSPQICIELSQTAETKKI